MKHIFQLITFLSAAVIALQIRIVQSLTLPKDQRDAYNGKVIGSLDNPVEVNVHFLLHHAAINEDDHDMTLTMDVIEEWTQQKNQQSNSIAQPEVDANNRSKTPKLNGTTANMTQYEITVINTGEVTILKTLTRSMEDGRIMKLTKLHISTPCTMNFFYFPFDKQTCWIKLIPGGLSDKEITLMTATGSEPAKLEESDDISLYPLKKYKITQISMNDDFGVFNQSGLELQLMFVRQAERSFPFLYFPIIALMIISIISLYFNSTINSVCLTLASFLTMIVWVLGCQHIVSHTGFTTLLDHYHFLCLNLSLNAVMVSIMRHLFLQSGSKYKACARTPYISESDQSGTLLEDVKLELHAVPNNTVRNGNGASKSVSITNNEQNIQTHPENFAEAHIYKMGKFKQFIYFKSVKPAKHQLPIIFLVINVIYWTWVLIARFHVPSGFVNF